MGLEDPAEWAELGAKTRQRKQKDVTLPELQDVWRSRMSAPELDALATLEGKLGGDADPTDPNASARALQYAIGHVFERKSVVPQRELLATALKHSVGEATVEQVLSHAEKTDLIVGERNGRQMATHRDVLKEESRVIDFARKGRGACRAFSKSHESFKRDWLNDAQKVGRTSYRRIARSGYFASRVRWCGQDHAHARGGRGARRGRDKGVRLCSIGGCQPRRAARRRL